LNEFEPLISLVISFDVVSMSVDLEVGIIFFVADVTFFSVVVCRVDTLAGNALFVTVVVVK
jgi:hypothetical protein